MDPSATGRTFEAGVSSIVPHDHVCLIYDSVEEQRQAMGAFIRFGLERHERCLYVADTTTFGGVSEWLRHGGVDVASATGGGSLLIATEREAYLAGGRFDPDAMLAMATGQAHQSVRDGYSALRIAGEMTWALGDDVGAERVLEYETKVNRTLPSTPALALCQYDRHRFSPEVLRDVIRTHPLVAIGGRVCRNFYYVPPGDLVGPDRLQHDVDRLLENILERERAEDALRASERRLSLVLEGSQDAFWDLDLTSRRVAYSPRWLEMLGRGPSNLEDRLDAWREVIHPDDLEATAAAVQAHLSGRTPAFTAESRVRGADGTWRWVLGRGRVVERGPGGEPLRMAGTVTEVTERRALQARLELSGRLASVGTLAAGVAHEVNNPLAFIGANLGWLAEQLEEGWPAEVGPRVAELRKVVAEALDGAARVGQIVQGLRRFARPAAEGQLGPADVGAEVQAAVGIARHQVAARAQLVVDVAPGLPPVLAGPHQLAQVVVNLLVNAAQAIEEGRVARNEVRLSARAEGGRVVVEVSDTGLGIPSEVLPHVFDPFFTTKGPSTGTGLGLAICHGIVTAAGGTIEVSSRLGHGTTFRVALPASEGAAPPGLTRPPGTGGVRRRVLVIDDEPLMGRAISRILGDEHDVEAVTSPSLAVGRLEAGERWDVVLCDLIMPELTGMELAARLRRTAPDVLERIVFMTGGAFTESSRAFLDSGHHRHVEKPFTPDALRALVAGAL